MPRKRSTHAGPHLWKALSSTSVSVWEKKR